MPYLTLTFDLCAVDQNAPEGAFRDIIDRIGETVADQLLFLAPGESTDLIDAQGATVGNAQVGAIHPATVPSGLSDVYAEGESNGGSIDWSAIDNLHDLALAYLGLSENF